MTSIDRGLYKVLIIGGGPAGVGVLVRAARTGFLPRLLNPALHGDAKDVEKSEQLGMQQKGIAIVHDGDESTFGSGTLGKYLINSNTFARSLLSSILDEKPDLVPPESIKGTFLEQAKDHDSTRKLEETGNAPACLTDFGLFLQNVGACLMKELSANAETSKCLLNTRATRFEHLNSGIYRVEVVENERIITLHTEHLVLAMGGYQQLPPQLENNTAYKAKSFLSEDCLREDGFTRLRDHLLQSNDRKVCIVGGSHSSFSVAWLLLNKGTPQRKKSFVPSSPTKQSGGDLTINSDAASIPTKLDAPRSPLETAESDAPSSVSKAKPQSLGFQPRDITILHRSPIRCYYSSRKEAEADGADGSRVDRTGCVNTFTGLREDAKNLYKDVKIGKEARVRLFQVNQHGSQSLMTKAYESANAIVWSCGYASRMLPGIDEQGKPFKYYEDHGVVKLDMLARVQLVEPTKTIVPATNLYGVGLGFSLRSHVDEMGTETRADGVTVYHRRGATLVLAALFGPDVFGKDTQSFEEMVEKNDKNRKKKEPSSTTIGEASLTDRIKRSPAVPAPPQSPSSPTKLGSPVKASSNATAVVSIVAPAPIISLEKSGYRRVARKAGSSHATNPQDAAAVTNPPVKMLLQRRRSAETLHPHKTTNSRTATTSLSKATLLKSRINNAPFVDRRPQAPDTATPVA